MTMFTQKILMLCVLSLLSLQNVLGVHVTIGNNLADNLDLTVHCKSADDDIGIHLLHQRDIFGWHFGNNFIGETRFYCSFQWNDELKWFDIYVERRDLHKCNSHCNWYVTQSGPCRMVDANEKNAHCSSWNK
ncbi:putative plant self-incompatibility S1 [Medicago truncatula]|uniref:S-protein homolog n=1 Tax=Medicago truncatula TaxID=3880 RepID=A0A072VKH0_MEDTR|nr:leguminosin group486 secreted peptide [Medicago truncatula]RHN79449.1 putative plant self-incompatibility S1 [Medicago truncatula]